MNLKIGPMTYEVVEVTGFHRDGELLNGFIVHNEGKCYLEKDMCPQMKLITLWHETLHAILTNAGWVQKHNEQMIEALANGIVLALQDNPVLKDGLT